MDKYEDKQFPGRNLSLHITKHAWENIVSRVESNAKIKEAKEMEMFRKKAMKNEHDAMVEHWENSIKVRNYVYCKTAMYTGCLNDV